MAWRGWWIALAALLTSPAAAQPVPLVTFTADAPGFAIADAAGAADIVVARGDHPVVALAAGDLAADIARVSGQRSRIANTAHSRVQIWAGTLGRNPAIDRLLSQRRLVVTGLRGAWESFVIAGVDRPAPGVEHALVIVGSDRRGTAFGLYEVSRAIGVSPWHWWADVTPEHHAILRIAPGLHRFGPPSVKYRGIFLNDEDWGLEPWAANTFEPEHGTIGPKTYGKLFELMLRLKANTVWPAMHKVTRAFNADPENARLADRYAIVMGSSHAEPMLRDNVGEWRAPAEDFNYLTNPAGVARYWRERVQANGRYENVWTLGMRGIHDSGIVGPTTDAGRRQLLERIFADQRAVLRQYVNRRVESVPQVFTPYKEVLDVYRGGLKVPDDVTLMWPDDNFGYVRHFPDAAERKRSGGSGVYYHLSYLGAPLSYIWLSTTPPALIREEMGRAWDAGARRMWIANVGDLKPAELDVDYFLQLAWDVPGTRARTINEFVGDWATQTIGRDVAPEVASILAEHHRLNFARRPEHLQWWLPGEASTPSPLTPAEVAQRLTDFDRLRARVRALESRIAPERRDAFFELVDYPVTGAALANTRVFAAEAHDRLRDTDPAEAARQGAAARAADGALTALTGRYNQELAGGKWRGIMAVEPADGQWRRFRITPPVLPAADAPAAAATRTPSASPQPPAVPAVEAESAQGTPAGWRVVEGLGRNGLAVTADAPARLSYRITLPAGRWRAVAEVLPTYPLIDGAPLRLALVADGGAAIPVVAERRTGDKQWARAVLDNRIDMAIPLDLAGGDHRIEVRLDGPGIILDRLRFEPVSTQNKAGERPPSDRRVQ